MNRPVPYSTRFRHVVFPGLLHQCQKALNLGDPNWEDILPSREVFPLSQDHASFVRWLFSLAGLDARQYRGETLDRRLPACLRILRVRSVLEARHLLESKPALVAPAISAMIVGVTSFFRDPLVFDMLKREVVPALAAGREGLKVWSAGCSEGAELYSLAFLLAEGNLLQGSYLLGTDCRPDAIDHARKGTFDQAAIKEVPGRLLNQFFPCDGSRWQVIPSIRQTLRWRIADILTTPEPGIWDMIFFRNTAIYLKTEATYPLWERFEIALRPGGVLILGKAERPAGTKRLSPWGHCVYRRTGG